MHQTIKSQEILSVFNSFSPEVSEYLSKYAFFKKIAANTQILRSGDSLKYTLLVTKGKIKLYTKNLNDDEFFIYYIEPGEACALSFICAAKNILSEVDGIAVEDSEIILVPKDLMDELFLNHKSWYYFVLDTYRKRYQELLEVIKSIAFNSMDERLMVYLKKQQKTFKSNKLFLTHEIIANDLNTSRVVI